MTKRITFGRDLFHDFDDHNIPYYPLNASGEVSILFDDVA